MLQRFELFFIALVLFAACSSSRSATPTVQSTVRNIALADASLDTAAPPLQTSPPPRPAFRARYFSEVWRREAHVPIANSGEYLLVRQSPYPEHSIYHLLHPENGTPYTTLSWIVPELPGNNYFHRNALLANAESIAIFAGNSQHSPRHWSARERRTGNEHWSLDTHATIVHMLQNDALVSIPSQQHQRIERRDVRTGRAYWTLDLAPHVLLSHPFSSRIVTVDWSSSPQQANVRAYSLHDGRALWQSEIPLRQSNTVLKTMDEHTIALVSEHTLFVLDAQNGSLRWRATEPPARLDFSELALLDDLLVVQWNRAQTIAYDRNTGAVRWQVNNRYLCIVAHGDLLFASSHTRLTQLLDPSNGQPLWSYGHTAGCRPEDEGILHRPGATAELFLRSANQLIAFRRAAEAPPSSPLVVTGTLQLNRRPAAGVTVQLGDSTTQTDRNGRYRIETTALGSLLLSFREEDITRTQPRRPCLIPGLADLIVQNDGQTHTHNPSLRSSPLESCGQCGCE